MPTGCLITDPPQFNPLPHSTPVLLQATADPDPRTVVTVGAQHVFTFGADVMSQDDPLESDSHFQHVESRLYIDLGYVDVDPRQPYLKVIHGTGLLPGTFQQTGRRVKADWYPPANMTPGCHTATLTVSHWFDYFECPVCPNDYSQITWYLLVCETGTSCTSLPVHGPGSCDGLTNSCAAAQAAEADAGTAIACPDTTAVDGGGA